MIKYDINSKDMKIKITVEDTKMEELLFDDNKRFVCAAILTEAAHEILGVIEHTTGMPFNTILDMMKDTNNNYPISEGTLLKRSSYERFFKDV